MENEGRIPSLNFEVCDEEEIRFLSMKELNEVGLTYESKERALENSQPQKT